MAIREKVLLLSRQGEGRTAATEFRIPPSAQICDTSPMGKPRTIFFSAGEPSGDLHAANLIRQLRRQCRGRRGGRLRRAANGGGRLPAARRSDRAGRDVVRPRACRICHKFWGLVSRADRYFRHQRPDAVVLIDYPGLQLVDRAAGQGPRHSGLLLHAAADLGLGAVAGEEDAATGGPRAVQPAVRGDRGCAEHGCHATFVGHPFFDEVRRQAAGRGVPGRRQRASPGRW